MTRNHTRESVVAPAPGLARPAFESADGSWEQVLVCPTCGEGLTREYDNLLCGPCRKEWPVVDGVPTFAEHLPYRCEIPQEPMSKVNALLRDGHDYRAVLLQSDDPSVRNAAETTLNVYCANWHWLTGLSPQSRVLDVGAGLGAQSHALAGRFREVFALEPVREQVDFMQRRFAQDGVRNVKILRTSPWDLPFPPASFDLVAMNGTLPWLATGREGNPRDLQVAMLKRAFQLLAPGGYLYLGTENRMFWRSFAGAMDVHSGLPFVSVLPRPVANWYAKRQGRAEGYRNYTYSTRGYRKILAAAGFTDIRIYLAIPSYTAPRLYIPLKESIFRYYHENFEPLRSGLLATVASRVLTSLGLLKHIQNSFVILARKEP